MTKTTLKAAALVLVLLSSYRAAAAEPQSIRVMSFNIRFGTANDGDNRWEKRHHVVLKTIRDFDPDLLGTQETLGFQADYLGENLKHFARIGRSRDKEDGPNGEQCTVFFRKDRFEELEHGHMWLSEKPNEPGSMSWDTSLTRMATWVKLKDKRSESELFFINTHFDHRGKVARLEAAKLLRRFIQNLGESKRVILTGDFNCGEDSDPYKAMFPKQAEFRLVDTYRAKNKERGEDEGTFNGFRGRNSGARIDWVVTTSNLEIQSAEIVRANEDGRYPSDHYPVTATVK